MCLSLCHIKLWGFLMDAFCLYKTSIISIFSVTFRSVDSFFIINEYFHSFKKNICFIFCAFTFFSYYMENSWNVAKILAQENNLSNIDWTGTDSCEFTFLLLLRNLTPMTDSPVFYSDFKRCVAFISMAK